MLRKIFLALAIVPLIGNWGFAQTCGIAVHRSNVPGAGPVVVQSITCAVSTTSCSQTFGQAVGAGHYLLCFAGGTGNSTGVSCTMTGETIPRLTGSTRCSNGAGYEGDCYLSTNTVGGQTSITCTMSTGSGGLCEFAEITSPSGGHAIDVGGNSHPVTTAMSVSTSVANTNANDLCLGMAFTAFASPGYTSLNWTSVVNVVNGASILLESTVPGSTGSVQTATATAPTGTTNQTAGVICLKP
jgi:hypothetical protein